MSQQCENGGTHHEQIQVQDHSAQLKKNHELSNAHNILPFITGEYIQSLANPGDENSFITVMEVTQLVKLRHEAPCDEVNVLQSKRQPGFRRSSVIDPNRIKTSKDFHSEVLDIFEYKTEELFQATGPQLGKECSELRNQLANKGMKLSQDGGKWKMRHECYHGEKKGMLDLLEEEDDHANHQDNVWSWTKQTSSFEKNPTWQFEDDHRKQVQDQAELNNSDAILKTESGKTKHTYIISLWEYDENVDRLRCKQQEVQIQDPAYQKDKTIRFLTISQYEKVAFYFERLTEKSKKQLLDEKKVRPQDLANCHICYVELNTQNLREIRRVPIPRTRQLSDLIISEGIARLNIGRFDLNGRSYLHYTVWKGIGPASKDQQSQLVGEKQEPECTMKFLDLGRMDCASRAQETFPWEINNADSLLDVETEGEGSVWVLGINQKQEDVIRHLKWMRDPSRKPITEMRINEIQYTNSYNTRALGIAEIRNLERCNWLTRKPEKRLGLIRKVKNKQTIHFKEFRVNHDECYNIQMYLNKARTRFISVLNRQDVRSYKVTKNGSFGFAEINTKQNKKKQSQKSVWLLAKHYPDDEMRLVEIKMKLGEEDKKYEFVCQSEECQKAEADEFQLKLCMYGIEGEDSYTDAGKPQMYQYDTIYGSIDKRGVTEETGCYQKELILTRRDFEQIEDDSDDNSGDLVRGFFFHEDRKSFSFMRTDWEFVEDDYCWSLRVQPQTWEAQYPSVVYRSPSASGQTLYLVNLLRPDAIRKLNLDSNWQFVCFVEDRDGNNDGFTIFTFIAEYTGFGASQEMANDDFYLMRLTVKCFQSSHNQNTVAFQEIIGKVTNLGQEFRTSEIVFAKMIRKSKVLQGGPMFRNQKQVAVVFQLKNHSLSIHRIEQTAPEQGQKKENKSQSIRLTPGGQSNYWGRLQTPRHGEQDRPNQEQISPEDQQKELDLKQKFQNKVLAEPGQLLHRPMLLGRYGDAIFYLKRDRESPWITFERTEIKPAPITDELNLMNVKTETIYKIVNNPICLFTFDLVQEHSIIEKCGCPDFQHDATKGKDHGQLPLDAFYVMTTKKKIFRLVHGGQNAKRETGFEYIIDKAKKKSEFYYNHYWRIEKDHLEKEDTIILLHKMEEQPWEQTMFSERTFSFSDEKQGTSATYSYESNLFTGDSNKGINLKVASTVASREDVRQVRNIKGTMTQVGHYQVDCRQTGNENSNALQPDTSARMFFVKPSPGTRAIDILGMYGPMPKPNCDPIFIGTKYILFTWDEEDEEGVTKSSSYLYLTSGRRICKIQNPVEIDTAGQFGVERIELADLHIHKTSRNKKYFMLKKEEIIVKNKPEKNKVFVGISELDEQVKGQFKFQDMNKLVYVGNPAQFASMLFLVTDKGKLVSVSYSFTEEVAMGKFDGRVTYDHSQHWQKFEIRLSKVAEGVLKSLGGNSVKLLQLAVTDNYLIILLPDTRIAKIDGELLTENFTDIEIQWITGEGENLDLSDYMLNQKERLNQSKSKLAITTTQNPGELQICTPDCLILWDLYYNKEISSLDNYKGIFDNAATYVSLPYKIPNASKNREEFIDLSPSKDAVLCSDDMLEGRVYKLYSELDLHLLQCIELQIHKAERDRNMMSFNLLIDISQTQISINGCSLYHLYYNQYAVFRTISEMLTGSKDTSTDIFTLEERQKFKNPLFSRAIQLIMMSDNGKEHNDSGKSAPNRSLDNSNFRCFDVMLALMTQCEGVQTSESMKSGGDDDNAKLMIEWDTPVVTGYMNNKFVKNEACNRIWKVKWLEKEDEEEEEGGLKVFAHPTSQITQKEVERITNPQKKRNSNEQEQEQQDGKPSENKLQSSIYEKSVDLKMLDFDWISDTDRVKEFIVLLADADRDSLFANENVKHFIELIWGEYHFAIRDRVFFPFARYFMCTFTLFTFFLGGVQERSMAFDLAHMFLLVMFLIDMVCFFALESIQISNVGFAYLRDFWNILDLTCLVLNTTVITMSMFKADQELIRLSAACAMIAMWIKLMYWMRLFKRTSHFIRMITLIMRDIRPFIVMLMICVGLFANAFLILDQSRRDNGMNSRDFISTPAIGNNLVDSVIRSYLVGLGEFGLDNFHKQNRVIVWVLFLASTFITQLVFLNMLIAIMGDTYASAQQHVTQSRLNETIQMVNDHVWIVDLQKVYGTSRYIFVVEVQGRNQLQQNPIEKKIETLSTFVDKQINKTQHVLSEQINELKAHVENLQQGETKLEQKMEDTKNSIEKVLKTMGEQRTEHTGKLAEIKECVGNLGKRDGDDEMNRSTMKGQGKSYKSQMRVKRQMKKIVEPLKDLKEETGIFGGHLKKGVRGIGKGLSGMASGILPFGNKSEAKPVENKRDAAQNEQEKPVTGNLMAIQTKDELQHLNLSELSSQPQTTRPKPKNYFDNWDSETLEDPTTLMPPQKQQNDDALSQSESVRLPQNSLRR